jgi:hypothetical protein
MRRPPAGEDVADRAENIAPWSTRHITALTSMTTRHKLTSLSHVVFVSYASQDKPAADLICKLLERAGIKCWIAPRNIPLGVDYTISILNAIDSSRVLLLLLSRASDNSPHVRRELERCVSKRIPILPVQIEPIEALSLPLEYFIRPYQWLDATTPPLESHVSQLTSSISQLTGSGTDAGHELQVGLVSVVSRKSSVEPSARPVAHRVMILYKRNEETDERLLSILDTELASQGYSVFKDRDLRCSPLSRQEFGYSKL